MFWEVLMIFTRITVNSHRMGGLPCIRSLRIPVGTVASMIAEGMIEAEILEAYPDLTLEDIREALRYAAEALQVIAFDRGRVRIWHLPIGGEDTPE
jgi:uncharacterized protein (DUF433 family)